MAKTLVFRNGPSTSLASITGTQGELFVDTTLNTVVVMDGVTSGGTTLARNADVQTLSSVTATNLATVSSNAFIAATTKATNTSYGIVQGNTTSILINNGVITLGSSITASWTIQQSSNGSLIFYYGGVARMSFDSAGTITALQNVRAFTTPN